VISVVYVSFWLAVSILFSILFRGVATSALATLAVWIFFSFFISIGASVAANVIVPLDNQSRENPELLMKRIKIQRNVSLVSPMQLYNDSTAIVIDPTRKTTRTFVLMGPLERMSQERFQRPLALLQSINIVIPHIITLLAVTFVCFGISYAIFMKQEIRSL
jgi:ABC-2 type transport system permease protein